MKTPLLLLALLAGFSFANSQNKAEMTLWANQHKPQLQALGQCPDDLREAILQLSSAPGVVDAMVKIQQESLAKFRGWSASLSTERKSELYLLSRYPELAHKLYTAPSTTSKDLEPILAKYPPEIHGLGLELASKKSLLQEFVSQLEQSKQVFKNSLKTHSDEVKAAGQLLQEHPEYLSALFQQPNLLKETGSWFKVMPKELSAMLVQLAGKLDTSSELENWKQVLIANPLAFKELQEAAKSYAYDSKEPEYRQHPRGNKPSFGTQQPRYFYESFYLHPSPWWFGRPDASVNVSYWYPLPNWVVSGSHTDENGITTIAHLPSFGFLGQHFGSLENCKRFPNLTHAMLLQWEAYGHRSEEFYAMVGKWVQDQGGKLQRDWLQNDDQRPDRLREFANFENRFLEKQDTEGKIPTRDELLVSLATEFPNLAASLPSPMQKAIPPGNKLPVNGSIEVNLELTESHYWRALSRLNNTWDSN